MEKFLAYQANVVKREDFSSGIQCSLLIYDDLEVFDCDFLDTSELNKIFREKDHVFHTFQFEFIALGMAPQEYWDSYLRNDLILIIVILIWTKFTFIKSLLFPHPWPQTQLDAALYGALLIFIPTLTFERQRVTRPKFFLLLGYITYYLSIIYTPTIHAYCALFLLFLHGTSFMSSPFVSILFAIAVTRCVNLMVENPFNNLVRKKIINVKRKGFGTLK